ncbi:uncharacterized protein LOC144143493 [Haemaphysalis longicornis]
MDDTADPCPVSARLPGEEYATLTPVVPTYHVHHGPTHGQQAAATALFPAFFCGGTALPELPAATADLHDLPAMAAFVPAAVCAEEAPSPDFSINSDSDDSSSEKSGATDPFAPECKIPLPVPYSAYDYWLEPTFIRRRNERERQRVRHVNDGFERLRCRLPLPARDKDRRLSKVETLRYAISYIRHLQRTLGMADDDDEDDENSSRR